MFSLSDPKPEFKEQHVLPREAIEPQVSLVKRREEFRSPGKFDENKLTRISNNAHTISIAKSNPTAKVCFRFRGGRLLCNPAASPMQLDPESN